MAQNAAELSRRLAEDPEAVCRRYLSQGRREGRYWRVGDVANTPGPQPLRASRQRGERGRASAGRWTDAATGEHGDLLDLIGKSTEPALPWPTSSPKPGPSSASRDREPLHRPN